MKSVHTALVCISRVAPLVAPPPNGPPSGLAALEADAVHHDEHLDVRGVLVCVAQHFVQWLEGPSADVLELFGRIQQDPRHAEVRCLYQGPATGLLKAWSVGVMSRPDLDQAVLPGLLALPEAAPSPPAHLSPAAIFRGVLMPHKICGDAPVPLSRVGLLGQTGVWPTSVLMHLSQQWDQPVGRSRLVLGDDVQVHSIVLEYLNVCHPELGALRLENYSGDIAQLDVMPALVDHLDAAVLFMAQGQWAEQEAYFQSCMEQLGEANEGIYLLCVFSQRSAEHIPALTELAQRLGRPVQVQTCLLSDSAAILIEVKEALLRQMAVRVAAPAPPSPAAEWPPRAAAEPDPALELAAQWLKTVAAIEGVAAVVLRVPGAQGDMRLSVEGCTPVGEGSASGEAGASQALRLQALMDGLADVSTPGQPSTQWLVRTDRRLLLAMAVPDHAGWVLALESVPGAVNAGLLLASLRRQLALLQPEAQAC